MPLSNNERQILAQLEESLSEADEKLAGIERRTLRRRALTPVLVPIGVIAGLVLVVLGVALNSWVGTMLAVAAYLVLVASTEAGVVGTRRLRAARRARRPGSTG